MTVPLNGEDAYENALSIFRINYDLIAKKKGMDWPTEAG